MINSAFEVDQNDVDQLRKNTVKLKWTNINVFTKPESKRFFHRKKTKPSSQILKYVNGEAKSGEVLVIMGASGSGKTTLLNVLNKRNCETFTVTGRISVNGRPIDKKMARISAYVQQEDLMLPTLTVREHLTFQATLRMDKVEDSSKRSEFIDKILVDFGLKKCENTKIGGIIMHSQIKGISGGEKKRLAIASEILTNPSVLYLDEPTSCLDSFMAESVADSLKNLAMTGKTVICTIHQPSSQLFKKFDRLMLLAEGRVAYFGPLSDAENFFHYCGIPCPRFFNPADHYIQTLAIVPGEEKESLAIVNKICDSFDSCDMNIFQGVNVISNGEIKIDNDELETSSKYKSSWLQQFQTILHRSFLCTLRTPIVTSIGLMQALVLSIIIGLVYLNQKNDGKGIMNINGVMFLNMTQMSFPYLFAVVTTLCLELPIFLREHWNGMYRVDAYFLAKNLAELPVMLLSVIIYGSINYWMIGLNPDPKVFLMYIGVSILLANTAASFGYMISSLSSTPQVAMSIAPPLLLPLMLFGGLFLNAGSIPNYCLWIRYLSWFSYGYEIFIVNQWSSVDKTQCELPELNVNNAISSDLLKDKIICPPSGDVIIKSFSFDEKNLSFDYGMIVALLLGYRLLSFVFLSIKARRRH